LVFGGGLAGLTAGLQLKRMRPRTRVVVVEKRTHPVPEAAFKVGESVAEIGAHYLKEVIDFKHHMEEHQIRKFSLRVFASTDDNRDVSRRPEIGLHRISPLRTYQIDRGRLENALVEAVVDAGVELLDGYSVSSFSLGPDRHSAVVKRNGDVREYTGRWIVDATGRVGLLRRHLHLGVDIPHDVNSAWFRIPDRLVIDEWSDDPAWRARVPNGKRWMSTNHLVGEGYWIWLIPLPSGPHSVGIVADPRFVPFERIRRYEQLIEWLHENEPQLASKLPQSEDGLQDFRKVKNYAYGARRGLSLQRWCLTGEAGLFLDPLYATGLDFIAVSNTLATRLICGALEDEPDLRRRLKAYNSYYLGQFLGWEPAFAGQYEVFRDPQATAAKVLWDNIAYFMYPVLLFNKDCMLDYRFVASVRERFKEHYPLNIWMQRFFREWSRAEYDKRAAGFVLGTDQFIGELFETAAGSLTKPEVAELIDLNVRRLRVVSKEMVERMAEVAGMRVEMPENGRHDAAPDEALLEWSPYEQRTAPTAQTEPQPEGSWMLR